MQLKAGESTSFALGLGDSVVVANVLIIIEGDSGQFVAAATTFGPYAQGALVRVIGGVGGGTCDITDVSAPIGSSAITDGAVGNSKLADAPAGTIKLRAVGAGTGAPTDGTAAQARLLLGITQVNDTSDINKPLSTAQTIAIATAQNAAITTAATDATAKANARQSLLIPGANIKTINGVSPLGAGNLVISGSLGVSFSRIAGATDDVGSTYLAVAPTGMTVAQWQWTLGGADIAGATNSSYTTTAAGALNVYAKAYQLNGTGVVVTTPAANLNYAFASTADASRFLRFGTWGVNDADIASAMTLGAMDLWIEDQFTKPTTSNIAFFDANYPTNSYLDVNHVNTRKFLVDSDQLRQRVAFALSEFVVASDRALVYPECPVAHSDLFFTHAFGNYRTFLEAIFKSPLMGQWLSYFGNPKAVGNAIPDQNMAREIMQLFSIGLVQLNLDGSSVIANGSAVETYTSADIVGLSRVFTGWGGADGTFTQLGGILSLGAQSRNPMIPYEAYHETGTKTFLGITIPANTLAQASLTIALDTIFNHANVGPYVAKNLIQRLITSNPQPAYIARVAAAFNNNGSGVRGDMKAVIRAIYLDSEVVTTNRTTPVNNWGRIVNPIQRMVGFLRSLEAVSTTFPTIPTSIFGTVVDGSYLGMKPWDAPSVFGFTPPGYYASSEAATAGTKTPELSLYGESGFARNWGALALFAGEGGSRGRGTGPTDNPRAPYTKEAALAIPALVDRCILLFAGGQMSAATRTSIINAVTASANSDVPNGRVGSAINLVMNAPETVVQK